MSTGKKIVIIASPNGARKTTLARKFLPKEAKCPDFINVDLIAAGLPAFAPDNSWVLYDNSGPVARLLDAGDNPP